jgi:hypothetical protein
MSLPFAQPEINLLMPLYCGSTKLPLLPLHFGITSEQCLCSVIAITATELVPDMFKASVVHTHFLRLRLFYGKMLAERHFLQHLLELLFFSIGLGNKRERERARVQHDRRVDGTNQLLF